MIKRIWKGWTKPENADAYGRVLLGEVVPGIESRGIDGFHGMSVLRRELDDEVEFVTIMWFESLDAVRAFSGRDYETAVVPPSAQAVLSRFDATSAHYETLRPPSAC